MTEPKDPKHPDADNSGDSPQDAAPESTEKKPEASTAETAEQSNAESTESAEEASAVETHPGEEDAVQKPDDSLDQSQQDSQPLVKPERNQKPTWRLWLVAIILLVLIGFSALGYWGYRFILELNQAQEQALSDLSEQQAQLSQAQTSLENQLRQTEQARQQLADTLRTEQQQLEQMMVETAQRLSRRQDLEADRWPLEEALALLRLAERRLQLDGNADVALRLVEAADQVLSGLTQAAVLPVRRQLARDRLALQAVESADTNGLYFRLSAISEHVRGLSWTPEASITPEALSEEALSWQAFKESLSSIITITRLEVSHQAAPLLSDFALWQQQSLLLIEQAQLALLAGNQALYDAALEQLSERFTSMQASLSLTAVREEVAALSQAQLVPELPDIHGSIEALEDYMVNLQVEDDSNGGDDS